MAWMAGSFYRIGRRAQSAGPGPIYMQESLADCLSRSSASAILTGGGFHELCPARVA